MAGLHKGGKRAQGPDQRGAEGRTPPYKTLPRKRVVFGIGLTAGASKSVASAHAKAASLHALTLTVDHGLAAVGVAVAVASASFAGFMIVRDNSHPMFGGVEHLMIFAQPIGGAPNHRPLPLERGANRPVDYNATGSIDDAAAGASGLEAPRASELAAAPEALKGYVLRFARNGAVMVEGPKGSFAAMPGATLPDAGRILSIENRNGRWVIMTENGMIAEAKL